MAELQKKRVLLLSTEATIGEWLLDDLGAIEDDGDPCIELSNVRLAFTLCRPEEVAEQVKSADIAIGLARFMDVETLDALSATTEILSAKRGLPTAFMAYREDGESDYKMSCPFCGQKLWVRDADVDKRGRCPNCKKGFTLPKQEDLLTAKLGLPASAIVAKIFKGNPSSISGPLNTLIGILKAAEVLKTSSGRDAASQRTARVEVQDDE